MNDPQVHAPTHPPASTEPTDPPRARRALVRLDPGWLFLLSGIALIASVVLIPAQHDLQDARWQRDRAVAIEQHRVERLERYGKYLAAAKSGDECVLLSLGATQLNMAPADRIPLMPPPDVARTSASVFPSLEPGELKLPELPRDRELSMLERLTVNNTTRLWLIAGGVLCVLFGLLPETSRAAADALRGAAATGIGVAGEVITEAKLMAEQRAAVGAEADGADMDEFGARTRDASATTAVLDGVGGDDDDLDLDEDEEEGDEEEDEDEEDDEDEWEDDAAADDGDEDEVEVEDRV